MFANALVVGKFAPFHKGHQFLIDTAIRECLQVTVLVYSNPDFPECPQKIRANWIRSLYPNVSVLEPTGMPPDDSDGHTHRVFVSDFLAAARIHVDSVYTSEGYGDEFAKHLGVTHRMVDRLRTRFNVSGTNLRLNVHGNRDFMDPLVYRHFVEMIVLLGAESTGKSTLAVSLAEALGTEFVAEYGREYYERKGRVLTLDDYVTIALEHRKIEESAALRANRYLVVDTNAITTLFYSYYYNGSALPELHALADDCAERYRYVYVCADDIPFEQDGSRDSEELRSKSHRMVMMDLTNRGFPWTLLTGSLEQRIATVITDIRAEVQ